MSWILCKITKSTYQYGMSYRNRGPKQRRQALIKWLTIRLVGVQILTISICLTYPCKAMLSLRSEPNRCDHLVWSVARACKVPQVRTWLFMTRYLMHKMIDQFRKFWIKQEKRAWVKSRKSFFHRLTRYWQKWESIKKNTILKSSWSFRRNLLEQQMSYFRKPKAIVTLVGDNCQCTERHRSLKTISHCTLQTKKMTTSTWHGCSTQTIQRATAW